MFQRFDPNFGNTELVNETNRSLHFQVNQKVGPSLQNVSFSVYRKWAKNRIDFESGAFRYANLGSEAFSGLDFGLERRILNRVNMKSQISWIFSDRIRQPRRRLIHSVEVSAFKNRLKPQLSLEWVSKRFDRVSGQTISLPSYLLVDLSIPFQVSRKVRVFGSIENLLDRQYELVAGYSTYGRSIYGGMEVVW